MDYNTKFREPGSKCSGSLTNELNNLNNFPISQCKDSSSIMLKPISIGMSQISEAQFAENFTAYERPAYTANTLKPPMSNQRILADLSHSKPNFVATYNDTNLQKSEHNLTGGRAQNLCNVQEESLLLPPLEGSQQSMYPTQVGTGAPENSSTSIHISFSENYLQDDDREEWRNQTKSMNLDEISHCANAPGSTKNGSRY